MVKVSTGKSNFTNLTANSTRPEYATHNIVPAQGKIETVDFDLLKEEVKDWGNDIETWWENKAEPFIENISKKTGEVLEKTGATISTGVVSFVVEGVGQFLEAGVDLVALAGTGLASVGTGIYDGYQAINGKITGEQWESLTKKMWGDTKEFVATERVKSKFDEFYENTDIGQWMKENSYGFDTVRGIGSGAGYVAGVIGISVLTFGTGGIAIGGTSAAAGTVTAGQIATTAGLTGFSRGTERAWVNGADIVEGLEYGTLSGLWEGLQFFVGAKISAPGGFGDQIASKFMNNSLLAGSLARVTLDGATGGAEGFMQPLLDLVYKDSYKDANGNEVEFTDDMTFKDKYKEAFDDAGGWQNVGIQTAIGTGMSSFGEFGNLRNILAPEGSKNVDTNVKVETDNSVNYKKIIEDATGVTQKASAKGAPTSAVDSMFSPNNTSDMMFEKYQERNSMFSLLNTADDVFKQYQTKNNTEIQNRINEATGVSQYASAKGAPTSAADSMFSPLNTADDVFKQYQTKNNTEIQNRIDEVTGVSQYASAKGAPISAADSMFSPLNTADDVFKQYQTKNNTEIQNRINEATGINQNAGKYGAPIAASESAFAPERLSNESFEELQRNALDNGQGTRGMPTSEYDSMFRKIDEELESKIANIKDLDNITEHELVNILEDFVDILRMDPKYKTSGKNFDLLKSKNKYVRDFTTAIEELQKKDTKFIDLYLGGRKTGRTHSFYVGFEEHNFLHVVRVADESVKTLDVLEKLAKKIPGFKEINFDKLKSTVYYSGLVHDLGMSATDGGLRIIDHNFENLSDITIEVNGKELPKYKIEKQTETGYKITTYKYDEFGRIIKQKKNEPGITVEEAKKMFEEDNRLLPEKLKKKYPDKTQKELDEMYNQKKLDPTIITEDVNHNIAYNKITEIIKDKVGTKFRKSHPLNSAIRVMQNKELFGDDAEKIACLALIHSKSTSGVSDITSREQLSKMINTLYENRNFETANYDFDASKLVEVDENGKPIMDLKGKDGLQRYECRFKPGVAEELQAGAIALRVGDAHALKTGYNHGGGRIDIQKSANIEEVKAFWEDNPDADLEDYCDFEQARSFVDILYPEGKKMVDDIVHIDGTDGNAQMSRKIIVGERNAYNKPTSFDENGIVYTHTVVDSNKAPGCTWKFGIQEKFGEYKTFKEAVNQKVIVELPENTDEFTKTLYDNFATRYMEKNDWLQIEIKVVNEIKRSVI